VATVFGLIRSVVAIYCWGVPGGEQGQDLAVPIAEVRPVVGSDQRCVGPVATPQEATGPDSELGAVERSEHVIVGAEEESGDPGGRGGAHAGDTDPRHVGAEAVVEPEEHFEAVQFAGQFDFDDGQPAALDELFDQCRRVVDGDDVVAGSLADGARSRPRLLVGISDQDDSTWVCLRSVVRALRLPRCQVRRRGDVHPRAMTGLGLRWIPVARVHVCAYRCVVAAMT
jgi:hypothetical protein